MLGGRNATSLMKAKESRHVGTKAVVLRLSMVEIRVGSTYYYCGSSLINYCSSKTSGDFRSDLFLLGPESRFTLSQILGLIK